MGGLRGGWRGAARRAVLILLGLAALVAVVAAAAVAVTVTSPGWRLVRTAFHTTYTLPASYTQVVEHRFEGRRQREEFRVWQADGRRKVVQTAPRSFAGLTTVRDGRDLLVFAPGFPYVLKSHSLRALQAATGLRWWRPAFGHPHAAVAVGTLLDGTPARLVTVSARERVQTRLWLAPQTGFVLRQERYDRRGRLFDVTENRNFVAAPPDLAEALAARPPAGVKLLSDARRWRAEYVAFTLKKTAPFPFLAPRSLPGGYRLVYAEPLEAAGIRLVALHFARGRASFTLFEHPVREGPAESSGVLLPEPDGRVRLFRTTRDGLALSAVGHLTAAEARRLFSGLRLTYPTVGKENRAKDRTQELRP